MKNRLAEYRRTKKMTQSTLAEKAGISRVQVSNIETGKTKSARIETLTKISEALGATVSDIFLA